MLKIVILGTGNLAKHLYTAFLKADGVDVVQVVGRNQTELEHFLEHTNFFSSCLFLKATSIFVHL